MTGTTAATEPGAPAPGSAVARVLVVDDEPAIADLVSTTLRYEGFETATAGDGRAALESVEAFRPDLMVLDVMLPDLDGFEVQRKLIDRGLRVPVLFLTARDATEDKVRGLRVGADDYVTKPFSLEELVARIRAILRRTQGRPSRSVWCSTTSRWTRPPTRCSAPGEPIEFTPTEFALLRYFLLNPRRVLSKEQILDHVWHYDFGGDASIVETYVSYLRRKLGEPRLLYTVRGVGYVLRPPKAS
jgi:two-component system OmpR family response regulator